ncbi:sigma-E factor negative regulatory protein [Hydrogenophaga sp.]|uniref:sigma-E factor negative regulatory protein n=1 Tax=Hydrogenophaga sp. TaxID=1904254 RepID=UPI003AF6F30E
MNAEQNHNPLPADKADVIQSMGVNTALSAMVDGELGACEFEALMDSLETDALSSWHAYQVIGDVLRGHRDPTGAQPAADFLASVRTGLEARDTETRLPRLADAAALPLSGHGLREAANDAVFRWKLVAGFASLAAVMAVSWSVVSGSGSNGAAGAQLASNAPVISAPAAAVVTVATPVVSEPVAVNTGQGVVIRDAQLEALLAEHRQHGGMSALQMPSGFIRNATYEAAGR